VIVFSLLVSGSLGSLASNLFLKERLSRNVGRIALAIALISFVYRWIIPPVMQAFLAEDIFVRSLISMAMISPLGFLMGMPFPTGVRLLGSRNADEVPTMWGINGLTSVLGAVGAMILAMTAGFAVTLLVGSLFYLWIGIFFPKLS
jgi:hypothetical protein